MTVAKLHTTNRIINVRQNGTVVVLMSPLLDRSSNNEPVKRAIDMTQSDASPTLQKLRNPINLTVSKNAKTH
jgi:hypothetical protein